MKTKFISLFNHDCRRINHGIIPKFYISFAVISMLIFCLSVPGMSQNNNYYGWQFESQRKEIAPYWNIDSKMTFDQMPTLVLGGSGKAYADGHWYKTIEIISGEYYEFQVYFLADKVDEPGRSVLARILWQNEKGERVGEAEYPATLPQKNTEGWNIIQQVYQVPENATKARVELVYRWDADGLVFFGGFSLVQTDKPKSRIVRLGTVNLKPNESKGSKENLEKFAALVEKAANQKADIVCLPEAITLVGTNLDYISASEPVPGPSTMFLGEVAKKNHVYIVAGLLERIGDLVYNTAVLIDRNGQLAGKYHKVSLPREEIDGGITPGDSVAVFNTDFGKIGIMICWDVSFAEVARALTMKGAEIILMPIAGGHLILAQARALENQVYLVSSSYDMQSAIFDQEGMIIAEAADENSVAVAEIDLTKQKLWPWIGDFKNRIPREIPSRKAVSFR